MKFGGQLSSVPPHMKLQKHTRSNSISGVPSRAGFSKIDMTAGANTNNQYMEGSYLFEKYGVQNSREENSF